MLGRPAVPLACATLCAEPLETLAIGSKLQRRPRSRILCCQARGARLQGVGLALAVGSLSARFSGARRADCRQAGPCEGAAEAPDAGEAEVRHLARRLIGLTIKKRHCCYSFSCLPLAETYCLTFTACDLLPLAYYLIPITCHLLPAARASCVTKRHAIKNAHCTLAISFCGGGYAICNDMTAWFAPGSLCCVLRPFSPSE